MSGFTLDYVARLAAWTLIAFAVQGGLLAASWRLWSKIAGRWTARARHGLACLHFAALGVLPLATPLLLHGVVSTTAMADQPLARIGEAPGALDLAGVTAAAEPVALFWLAGVAAMAGLLILEWRRARATARGPAPIAIVAAVRRLSRDAGLACAPDVACAAVPAPCILGLRRPVLLVPPRLGTVLPSAELDAVIAHELVHVARCDYGWNLLQRAVLALLWIHPAAWFLYSRVRREREMRCDAIAARGRACDLARGLVRLAEARTSPALAQAANGSALAARLDRLAIASRAHEGDALAPLAVIAATFALLAVAAGGARLIDPALSGAYLASAFGPVLKFDAHDPLGSFQVSERQGRVLGAAIERTPVPRSAIRQAGQRVTVLDLAGRAALSLTVDPRGAIEWAPRK